jgi:hypothetical protein
VRLLSKNAQKLLVVTLTLVEEQFFE